MQRITRCPSTTIDRSADQQSGDTPSNRRSRPSLGPRLLSSESKRAALKTASGSRQAPLVLTSTNARIVVSGRVHGPSAGSILTTLRTLVSTSIWFGSMCSIVPSAWVSVFTLSSLFTDRLVALPGTEIV